MLNMVETAMKFVVNVAFNVAMGLAIVCAHTENSKVIRKLS